MEQEYLDIINKIVTNRKYMKLKDERHHTTSNKYNHCCEVAYLTYKICKKYNLDYKSATKAALMHDFFFRKEVRLLNINHPKIALNNALKLDNLTEMEKNIILSHMYPFGFVFPKYKESIVVDFADDIISIKEKCLGDIKRFANACSFILVILLNIVR